MLNKVSEIMRPEVVTVAPSDNIKKAIDIMITKNVGSVVVVEDGKVVGILTERDVLKKIKDIDIDRTLVGEVMTSPVLTVMPDTFITEALALMQTRNIRRLPVMRGGRLVGIVTEIDILHWFFKVLRG
ncbi:MAG: CBS domain-containing protein [archaeon]|nr:CBS domain-containing protein [archaeon]MCP8321048.1 CBS domain-containing protein [archaeon]